MVDNTRIVRNDNGGSQRLDRRVLLGGAGGAAVAGIATRLGMAAPAAAQPATPATAKGGRATFVLVHGLWGGAWIWRDVIRLLRAAGHEVYAATATGLGDRSHLADPGIDLDVYITDVVNLLAYEDLRDVTLVGWSFGGVTVTGVAERVPERLAQVVYIDGDIPANGENFYDADSPSKESRNEALVADVTAGVQAGKPGFRVVTPDIEAWIRGEVKDRAVADWVLSKLTPQPMLTLLQPVRLGNPAAAALPRAFVLCKGDKDLQANPQTDPYVLTVQRVRSDPNWRVVELADGHLAPVNSPQLTAQALMSLV